MNICPLAEVGTRLEKAVSLLPGEPSDATEMFDRFEQVAIAILDSEHTDFLPFDDIQRIPRSMQINAYVQQVAILYRGVMPRYSFALLARLWGLLDRILGLYQLHL